MSRGKELRVQLLYFQFSLRAFVFSPVCFLLAGLVVPGTGVSLFHSPQRVGLLSLLGMKESLTFLGGSRKCLEALTTLYRTSVSCLACSCCLMWPLQRYQASPGPERTRASGGWISSPLVGFSSCGQEGLTFLSSVTSLVTHPFLLFWKLIDMSCSGSPPPCSSWSLWF